MTRYDKITLSKTPPLTPTRAFYIQPSNAQLSSITITDITTGPATPSSFITQPSNLTTTKPDPSAPPFLTLTKPSLLSTALSVHSPTGAPLASISGSTLTLGRHTINFLGEENSGRHSVTLAPAGHMARADEFVVDSVPYVWDVVDGMRKCELSKVVSGGTGRVEVGRFLGKGNGKTGEGVLVVDGEQVDVLVAILTCVAVVNRVDSFRF